MSIAMTKGANEYEKIKNTDIAMDDNPAYTAFDYPHRI
jgi:hypothetical protein